MRRAEDPHQVGQQRGVLVPGRGRIPRLPGPVGNAVACGQGAGVRRAEDPHQVGQQRGVLVPGRGCIPRLSGPVGDAVAGGQGVRVPGALDVGPEVEFVLAMG